MATETDGSNSATLRGRMDWLSRLGSLIPVPAPSRMLDGKEADRLRRATISIVGAAALSVGSMLSLDAEEAEWRCEIPVTVLDRDGSQRLGLTAANFRGEYLGQSLSIVSVRSDSLPRRVAVIVDTSGSMAENERVTWAAARDLVSALAPYNRAMILTLNVRLDQHSGLTGSPQELQEALRRAADATSWSPTALYDGVLDVSRECGTRWDLGDVVAVITDGEDSASVLNVADATTAMAGIGVRVSVVRIRAYRASRSSRSSADSWVHGVTEATGGLAVPADRKGVRSLASSIAQLYRLELVLPQGIDRSQEWKLKVVGQDGKALEGVKIIYPHYLARRRN